MYMPPVRQNDGITKRTQLAKKHSNKRRSYMELQFPNEKKVERNQKKEKKNRVKEMTSLISSKQRDSRAHLMRNNSTYTQREKKQFLIATTFRLGDVE